MLKGKGVAQTTLFKSTSVFHPPTNAAQIMKLPPPLFVLQYDPSADHYANFARALQEMLLQSGDDGFENATIVLLPTWPCEWDVDAKLWAPGNTSVEFSYKNGSVVSLDVVPPARYNAVKWAACV